MMKCALGQQGEIPAIGVGTWGITEEACIDIVKAALRLGYRHFDTAEAYHNEAQLGAALEESSVPREELFVTTKIWPTHFRPKLFKKAVDESLRKLRLDQVDLLLLHWPNEKLSLSELAGNLTQALSDGKTRFVGVSNFPLRLLKILVEDFQVPIAVQQIEYHALLSQSALLGYAREQGILTTAYSPLARGEILNHPVIERIASRWRRTSSQVALRWLIQQGNIAIIPKASSVLRLTENQSIFDFELDDEEMRAIAGLQTGRRIVDSEWAAWD